MRKILISIFILAGVLLAMCLNLNVNQNDSNKPQILTPSPTPFEPSSTPTPPIPITVQTPERNLSDFEKQVKITTLADFLHNSNWSLYYPNENPLVWDEKTKAMKLKPILENLSWSDGERVVGVYVCYNKSRNKYFLLLNLSWGEQIIVEPVVNKSYINWSLYQIGRVYSIKDYPYSCDERIGGTK